MYAGSAIGLALAGMLIGLVGWRGMYLLFALPGLAWAVGFARWFRNDPREHPSVNAAERAAGTLPGARPCRVSLKPIGL